MASKSIFVIDPGPVDSGYAIVEYGSGMITKIRNKGILPNIAIRSMCKEQAHIVDAIVIESVESYGMPVGAETFETVLWSGIFIESFGLACYRIPRKTVKITLCGSMKAKDGNIRQRLIDIYGEQGTKRDPRLLYGVSSHVWSCIALAHTFVELEASGGVSRLEFTTV